MRILFRVDAGPETGSGHFMRCQLLALALREREIKPGFLTSTPENVLLQEATENGFPLVPLDKDDAMSSTAIVEAATEAEAEVLIVDDHRSGLHDRPFQELVRQSGLRLMMISFQHEPYFVADAVHNQNLLALEHNYSAEDYTDLLLGPRYAVLDKAYRRLRPEAPQITNDVHTILLTFGGADHTGQTRKVVDALTQLASPPERVIVVVGGMYEDPDALNLYLDSMSLKTDLHVNTSRMPELMADADMAVSSGGLTVWELACLGVPNVILSTADTQRQTGELLAREGHAAYLGHHHEVSQADIVTRLDELVADPSRRRHMAQQSWQLVDGHGTERVVDYIGGLLT